MWRRATVLGLTLALASLSAAAQTPPPATGAAYWTTPTRGVSLARGASQTWSWAPPPGPYFAVARINYRIRAVGAVNSDSRLQCRLRPDGGGVTDTASAFVSTDQATATGAFSDESDDSSFTLSSAMWVTANFSVTCSNISVSTSAAAVMVDSVQVNLVRVASVANLPTAP